MPELRKSPFVDRWVIISTERARRPGNIVDDSGFHVNVDEDECVYCNNGAVPTYIYNDVRVVPFVDSEIDVHGGIKKSIKGVYEVIDGVGHHEVVVECKEHIANIVDLKVDKIADVIKTYGLRVEELRKNEDYCYAVIYKNYGTVAGSRNIGHARSHIFATPVYPFRVQEKLTSAKKYYDKNHRCIYCDVLKQERDAKKRVILETDKFLVITPFAAQFLFEMMILPKKHDCDFDRGVKGYESELAIILKTILGKLQTGLENVSYNYVVQTAPFRPQFKHDTNVKTINEDYHWHIEILPRLTRMAGFEKGTGFYICSVPPEAAAEFFKGVKIDG